MATDSLQKMQEAAPRILALFSEARQLDNAGKAALAQQARNQAGLLLDAMFGNWMDRFFLRRGVPDDEAQDLTQDTMLKLMGLSRDVKSNAFALICMARKSVFLDYLKRRKAGRRTANADGETQAEIQVSDESWELLGESVPEEKLPFEVADCVHTKLAQLRNVAPARAEVLEYYTEGLSAREIAAVMYAKPVSEVSPREEANMRARVYDLKKQAQALFAECKD